MLIKDLMTRNVITVGMDDTLTRVRSLFENHHFHHALVVEHLKLVGIISDRDLLKQLSPKLDTMAETRDDRKTLNQHCHLIMSRDLITIAPDETVYGAIALFNQHGVSCLPVVDQNEHPLGIVTWRDIFKEIERYKKRLGQTD
ncbi:MAG: CBS domain-containing protein [Kangiellaceae bacterium]|nr:CBS domain-containing protein [Kangiellaceae bacterium]